MSPQKTPDLRVILDPFHLPLHQLQGLLLESVRVLKTGDVVVEGRLGREGPVGGGCCSHGGCSGMSAIGGSTPAAISLFRRDRRQFRAVRERARGPERIGTDRRGHAGVYIAFVYGAPV